MTGAVAINEIDGALIAIDEIAEALAAVAINKIDEAPGVVMISGINEVC